MRKFLSDEEGQELLEYALIAGLLALAVAAFLPYTVSAVSTAINRAITALNNVAGSLGGS